MKPYTIQVHHQGATAICNLCDWRHTPGHAGAGAKPRHAQRAEEAAVEHIAEAHDGSDQ